MHQPEGDLGQGGSCFDCFEPDDRLGFLGLGLSAYWGTERVSLGASKGMVTAPGQAHGYHSATAHITHYSHLLIQYLFCPGWCGSED